MSLSRTSLAILAVLLIMLMWIHGRTYHAASLSAIPYIAQNRLLCELKKESNLPVFTVLVTENALTEPLHSLLCNNTVVQRQFSAVETHLSYGDFDTLRHINRGVAELALAKDHVVQVFSATETYGYVPLASYQDYATYLISRQEKPRLSKEYLLGKRLGLVDAPSSRSGHIIPKRMLNTLDMDDNNITIVYAESHDALRQLLADGRVDLISSYWQSTDGELFSDNYITPIEDNVSGSRWFLKLQQQNTDLFCAIQQVVYTLASQAEDDYFRQPSFAEGCGLNASDTWQEKP